ncbi:hypothetical protein Drorol1_Dr00004692 [Drosera rotundifolia]
MVSCLVFTANLSSDFMFSATKPRNWFLAGLRFGNRHRHRRPGPASEPDFTSSPEPWSPPEAAVTCHPWYGSFQPSGSAPNQSRFVYPLQLKKC